MDARGDVDLNTAKVITSKSDWSKPGGTCDSNMLVALVWCMG